MNMEIYFTLWITDNTFYKNSYIEEMAYTTMVIKTSWRVCGDHTTEALTQQKLVFGRGDAQKMYYETKCDYCEKKAEWIFT